VVDTATQDERFISPAALLGSSSTAAATMTTAGLTAGPVGMLATGAAVLVAVGGAAVVRKLGLRKAGDKTQAKKTGRKDAAGRGGLGRRGLLGGLRSKKGSGAGGKASGSSSRGARGGGLLDAARRVAGKAAQLAKRSAAGSKKAAGLLGSKGSAAGKSAGKGRGAGLVGGSGRKSGGSTGGKSGTSGTRGTKSGGSASNGTKRGGSNSGGNSGTGGAGRGGRLLGAAGRLLGRGYQGLFGGAPGGTTKASPTGSKTPKSPKGAKGAKGSGLLGGGKTKKNKAPKGASKDRGRDGNSPRAGKNKSTQPSAGNPGRGTSAGADTMPNPFASRYEAVSGAAPLEIERARDLIDYVDNAPDYAEAQARRWSSEADAIVAQIDIAPEFADALKDFATAQHQQVTKVREYGVMFQRAHADKLREIEEASPLKEKWDIGKNRD
jgi:hypothetical protein